MRSCTYQSVQMRTSTRLCLNQSRLLQLMRILDFLLSWFTALAVVFHSSTRTLTTSTPTENSMPSTSQDSPEALESTSLLEMGSPRNVIRSLLITLRNGGRELVWKNSYFLGTVLVVTCPAGTQFDILIEWGTSFSMIHGVLHPRWTTAGREVHHYHVEQHPFSRVNLTHLLQLG